MNKRGRNLGSVLRISVVLISILLGIFADISWAQSPYVVTQSPGPNAINVLINTQITVQFNMTMDTASAWIELEKEDDGDVMGTVQWRSTVFTNDTLVFVPQNALKPATHYYYEGNVQSATEGAWFQGSFITKYSLADATPPTVQTVYPYNGKTGVSIGESIYIRFSEAMNPSSITTPGNITLAGSGITGTSDYTVDIEGGDVDIRKNTPFSASSTYTVTITTNVRDLRGNPLKNQYQWSFTTGAADLIRPTVTQTIPAINDTKVDLFTQFHVVFSEEMDETTLNQANITLYDNTAPIGVPINIYQTNQDNVSFGPQSALTYNHNYTATIGTGVKDRAGGNGLLTPYTWSFTTAANSGIDSDPIINWGLSRDDQTGQRFSDGSTTKVLLGLGAWDEVTSSLTVTATTPPAYVWNLTGSPGGFGGYNYSYESAGNESLSSGNHTVTFTIRDGALNQVSFQRNIYIFGASPTLISPASGATGVSITPTFTWSYSGSPRPLYYGVAVFDGPDMNTAPMVWEGFMVDKGSGTHSIAIPADKQLAPNKTYYWGVRGANREENGETYAGLWPFTTGGTPPPAPQFAWTWVRSNDIYPPSLQGNLVAKVFGPSPADIVELKVTGPGGFQYIFTEDDIQRSEQLGQYYSRMFPNPLSNGTYNFSVTDSAGRTVTATKDFTSTSVPRVDFTTMVPADNTYVNTITPTLSWGSVGPGYYYKVYIWDWNGNQSPIYASDFIQDTSIIIPSGVLFPNTPYNWRVDVSDAPILGSNSSRSNNLRFSTGSSSYTPANMIEWVYFYSDNNHYSGIGKLISTNVVGPLPNEVTSFDVSGPGLNYNFQQSNIMYNLAWLQGSMYTYSQPGAVAGGTYNFSLQTPLGSDTYQKDLTPSTIPIVDQASMSPANNTYLNNLTLTFSWTSVGSYYYRILVMDWRSRFVIYVSTRSTDLFAAIPDGILKPNMSYMWRVEVYDNADGTVADNRSSSGWNCFTTSDSQGVLSVTTSEGLSASGPLGGPFNPSSKQYTLQNTGGTSIDWSAAKTNDWVDLSSAGGTLAPSASTTVTVSINNNANALAPGAYTDTVNFNNTTNGAGSTTRAVNLTVQVQGGLSVTPVEGLNSSGFEGGPFDPASKDYTLKNTGTTSISWGAAKTQAWVKLSKTSGTLAAGDSFTVNVSVLLTKAKMLDAGTFEDTITFTNKTNSLGNTTRKVNLLVNTINLNLLSPANLENYSVCTYYPAFGPPTFQWDVNGGTLKSLELQFYNDADPPKTVKVKATAAELTQKSLQVKASTWKSILLLPGTEGGEVNWKAVGTKQNNKKVDSDIRSFEVEAPGAVGNPKIDPISKATLPTLSWNDNCNSKFKVWFYNNSAYYDDPKTAGVKKTSLSFTDTDPTDYSGIYTKELTSGQWTAIQNVVEKLSGSTIYWHVESSDVVSTKRTARTDRQEFILKD